MFSYKSAQQIYEAQVKFYSRPETRPGWDNDKDSCVYVGTTEDGKPDMNCACAVGLLLPESFRKELWDDPANKSGLANLLSKFGGRLLRYFKVTKWFFFGNPIEEWLKSSQAAHDGVASKAYKYVDVADQKRAIVERLHFNAESYGLRVVR